MEIRCQIIYSLAIALSPETAPYLLEQEVQEPDPQILSLNADLVAYDEIVTRLLRPAECVFISRGLGVLVDRFLVSCAGRASPMNSLGCGRMLLNVLVLQQNLKNIETGVDLERATGYFGLFGRGPEGIVKRARAESERAAEGLARDEAGEKGRDNGDKDKKGDGAQFSYEELKTMMELCFSEQLANPERGIAGAARRQMGDRMLELSEFMWQR